MCLNFSLYILLSGSVEIYRQTAKEFSEFKKSHKVGAGAESSDAATDSTPQSAEKVTDKSTLGECIFVQSRYRFM